MNGIVNKTRLAEKRPGDKFEKKKNLENKTVQIKK